MENSSSKQYLSNRIINRLSHIIICQQIIGNDTKVFINKIDFDKYEIKIKISKHINPRSVTFVNCDFENKYSMIDYDSDFDISEEIFKIIVSETTKMSFIDKLYNEGFDFLIEEN